MRTEKLRKVVVIIGCAKSGTSALAQHIARHPEATHGRLKETKYFTDFSDRNWTGPASEAFTKTLISSFDEYVANFEDLRDGQWAIDASTDYVWCEKTPNLLAKFAETHDVRLICVVRDPVDRAVSEYNHTLRLGWETLSFTSSVEAETSRYKEGWHPLFYHKRRSTICEDIRGYADLFKDRLIVIDYADLKDAQRITDRICGFLGIPAVSATQIEKRNESSLPRNALAKAALDSAVLKRTARALLPAPARKIIWEGLHASSRKVVTVQDTERERFRELLSDEIDRCVKEPLIPTDNWTCL